MGSPPKVMCESGVARSQSLCGSAWQEAPLNNETFIFSQFPPRRRSRALGTPHRHPRGRALPSGQGRLAWPPGFLSALLQFWKNFPEFQGMKI